MTPAAMKILLRRLVEEVEKEAPEVVFLIWLQDGYEAEYASNSDASNSEGNLSVALREVAAQIEADAGGGR